MTLMMMMTLEKDLKEDEVEKIRKKRRRRKYD